MVMSRGVIAGWMLVLLLAACAGPSPEGPPGPHSTEPTRGPSVQRLDGEVIPLADLIVRDGDLLLVFMTAWCPTCLEEQPRVERFARETSDRLKTCFVLSGSSLESARALVEDRDIALELLVDSQGELAAHLEVQGTPTLILIDGGGRRAGTFFELEDVEGALASRPEASAWTLERPPRSLIADTGTELGTSYDVLVIAADEARARDDLAALRASLDQLAAVFSEWQPDSEISRLNRTAALEPVPCSRDLYHLLEGSLHVSAATKGAFDVSWRPLGRLWDRAEERGSLPRPDEIVVALEAVGWQGVHLENGTVRFERPGMRLGIAGVAKGWIIDELARQLREAGYEDFVVNIGGDLSAAGDDARGRPWRFDVRDPFGEGRVVTTLEVSNAAVATSGNAYRRRTIGGEHYGHLLDPRTGRPAAFEGSVTVITSDAAMADALATALYVMGPDEGLAFARRQPEVEALFVTRDGLRGTLPNLPR